MCFKKDISVLVRGIVRITFKKLCPLCGESQTYRIVRKCWMRFLPWSRFYKCTKCGERLLYIKLIPGNQKGKNHH